MNITGSLFAISQFESIKKKIESDKQPEKIIIETDKHKNIDKAIEKAIDEAIDEVIDEAIIENQEQRRKDERNTEKEKKLSSKQKVEGLSPSEECGAEGDRHDNKKEVVQGSESSSQKPKRGRIRKPRE